MEIGGVSGIVPTTLTFRPDGTMTSVSNGAEMTGTYTVTGNQLHMILKSGGAEIDETDAFVVDGDRLTLMTYFTQQKPVTFRRRPEGQ